MPDVAQRMRDIVQQPVKATPGEFRQYLERELAKWREVGKRVKIGSS
jgi:tripartite-type tricarboxylate transporter receptor subunit TctC